MRKVSGRPATRTEIIAKNINTLERGKLRPSINITADDGAPGGVRVIKDRIDSWRIWRRCRRGRRRRVSRILNEAFAVAPSVVFAPGGIGRLLHVDLFARGLTDIANQHPASRAIETIAK